MYDDGSWDEVMGLALDEARAALTSADVPVGAIVLGPDGAVIGRGRNGREASGDPTSHAEVEAIRAAAQVLARVPRLVIGAWDPKAGATGSVWDLVRDPRMNHFVEVRGGVREAECAALLTDFFATHRQRAPEEFMD